MALTTAQKSTLKAAILADGTLNVFPNTPDGNFDLALKLSTDVASPAFWVSKTSLSKDDIVGTTSVDGTVFNWTGTGYITRSQGERDAFNAIFSAAGVVNPSLPNVRQAFLDIFSGATAPAPANRTHIQAVARRVALRIERIFATGTGSTASPGLLTWEGRITDTDVQEARNS